MYTRYSNAPCLFSWIWLLRLAQVLCGFKIFTSSLVLHLIWNKETRKTWHLVGYKVLIFMVQDSFALYTMSKLNRPIILGYYSLHVFIVASYYTKKKKKQSITAWSSQGEEWYLKHYPCNPKFETTCSFLHKEKWKRY